MTKNCLCEHVDNMGTIAIRKLNTRKWISRANDRKLEVKFVLTSFDNVICWIFYMNRWLDSLPNLTTAMDMWIYLQRLLDCTFSCDRTSLECRWQRFGVHRIPHRSTSLTADRDDRARRAGGWAVRLREDVDGGPAQDGAQEAAAAAEEVPAVRATAGQGEQQENIGGVGRS